jgi:peptidoglycan-N-acetylglucosamine deacetylase
VVEEYLASQGIQIWSADFLADDWRHISSSRVFDLAIKRLEEKGKGILLLHDIQARTVAALPRILNELKARGYRIVHVVPATPQNPATPTEPQEWELHPISENVATSRWPKIPSFAFSDTGALPAPALSALDWPAIQPLSLAERDISRRLGHGVPIPARAPWPRPSETEASHAAIALPVPAPSVFQIREGLRAATQGRTPSRRAEHTGAADHQAISPHVGNPVRTIGVKSAHARTANVHRRGQAAHGRRGAIKHIVQVRKRSA